MPLAANFGCSALVHVRSLEFTLAEFTLTRIRPGSTSPWLDFTLARIRPGSNSPWLEFALARIRPGLNSPWLEFALA
jgi:hypothetical protein